MPDEETPSSESAEKAQKTAFKKTHAWIFDVTGIARKGWLQIIDEGVSARPFDKGWRPMAAFPKLDTGSARVILWADDVDKYIARIDIGGDRRWIIMEGLPALLANMPSLSALVQMAGVPPTRSRR